MTIDAAKFDYAASVTNVMASMCGYVDELLSNYKQRHASRKSLGAPTIAFLGHGRCGKDTAAVYFEQISGLKYGGSTSSVVLPLISCALRQDSDFAWKDRHNNREFWFRWCNELRRQDSTMLAKMNLSRGDICVGLRSDIELVNCLDGGVIDLPVWISNSRVEKDPTVEFSEADCCLTIDNSGSKWQFYHRLRVLHRMLTSYFHEERE